VPFFSLLDEQERAALAERVETVSKPAGTALFNYGDPGDSLYIVRAGEVEIFFKNDTGERIVLETAGKGDFFGEISLLDGGARTASAHVTKDLQAVVVDRGDLEEFLRRAPAAAMELLTAAGRRLRESAKLLRRTASRNINEETEDKRTDGHARGRLDLGLLRQPAVPVHPLRAVLRLDRPQHRPLARTRSAAGTRSRTAC
jgi:CRP-like cAMP-binding protein